MAKIVFEPYDELVATLRRQCVEMSCGNCNTCVNRQAADAIEELSRVAEVNVKRALKWAYDAEKAEEKLRWIPVTERLPEDGTDVLAYIERNAWGDDAAPYRKREIAIAYHVNGLWHVDGRSRVDCISWQALPEPPKEETDGEDRV